MSRGGGRGGGFRGGRGGAAMGGKQRIGGQEVSWDFDPDLVIETKPQEMFPKIDLPIARPATSFEKAAVARYRALRKSIREGPFYSVLGDNVRISKATTKRAAEFNPFDDNPTYTQKYKPPSRKLPKFDTRKYQLRFFPEELWETIDPTRKAKPDAALPRPNRARRPRLDDVEDDAEAKPGNDEDGETEAQADDDEEPEENPEDDFSEDDSEMGGDYNAENYFDGGDDDAGDIDGDGGDDLGGDY